MKLLGEYLKETTELTSTHLVEALRYQVGMKDKGDSVQLGEILITLGMASAEDISVALERQREDRGISSTGLNLGSVSYWLNRGSHS